MNYYKKLLLLGMLIGISLHAQSEGEELSVAAYRTLYSHILDEERTVVISVPAGYDYSSRQYPVLYMLDAEYADFAWSIGLVHHLSAYKIPEMIIVGVLNTNRNRDMWSYRIESLTNTMDDGAQNFMNFFAEELIPFIDEYYRTTSYRAIYGRSGAGHFVASCLLTQPDLFDAYLASSPVIGFSNDHLLRQAEEFFRTHTSLEKSFFIYYGDTDYNSVVKRIPVLEQIIQDNTPDDFTWGIKRVAGRHGPPESLYELLLMLFSDWKPVGRPVITPSRGDMLEGDSVIVHISGVHDPVFYTLDGTEPTRKSPRYTGPITIRETTTLNAKVVRGDLDEGRTIAAHFTVVDEYRPAQMVANATKGLKYAYIERQSFNRPERILEPPLRSGIVSSIDIGVRERDQFYLLQFEGFIKIPVSGKYRFTVFSNATTLYIDDEVFTSDHGLLPTEKVQDMCLEAGYHAVRIVSCILTEQVHELQLYWEGPGITKQVVPKTVFFYK